MSAATAPVAPTAPTVRTSRPLCWLYTASGEWHPAYAPWAGTDPERWVGRHARRVVFQSGDHDGFDGCPPTLTVLELDTRSPDDAAATAVNSDPKTQFVAAFDATPLPLANGDEDSHHHPVSVYALVEGLPALAKLVREFGPLLRWPTSSPIRDAAR